MTTDIIITNWYVLTVLKGFNSDLDISHLFSNGVSPEDIAILCVNLVNLVHNLNDSNAKLVRLFKTGRTPLLKQ